MQYGTTVRPLCAGALLAVFVSSSLVLAQEMAGTDSLFSMSLEQLLEMKITVATKGGGETSREAPSIVTIITREDIDHNNCRDLV